MVVCDPAIVPLDRGCDGAAIGIRVDSIPADEIPHVPADLVASVVVVHERGKV
jgi:hypothetical protein